MISTADLLHDLPFILYKAYVKAIGQIQTQPYSAIACFGFSQIKRQPIVWYWHFVVILIDVSILLWATMHTETCTDQFTLDQLIVEIISYAKGRLRQDVNQRG